MAVEATPPFQNPLERIGHTVREIPAWAGRHWKSLALTVAALGGAGYVSIQLARPYTPDTQVKATVPVSDTFKPADPGTDSEVGIPAVPTEAPPTATASPSPEPPPKAEPTATSTPEAESLPDVINNQTTKFVSLPSDEIQKLVDEATAKGEFKVPLPDIVTQPGFSLQEIHATTGESLLAITASQEGAYTLPALEKGKVTKLLVGRSANFSGVLVTTDSGIVWAYAFPSPGSTTLKEGDIINQNQLNEPIISFDYNSKSLNGQDFITYLKRQFKDAPLNTIAIITGGEMTTGLSKNNILTTSQGIITVANQPKK